MDRIINMIVRQVMRRLVNKGISAGIDMVSGGNNASGENGPQAKQAAKQMRQTAKVSRRVTRL